MEKNPAPKPASGATAPARAKQQHISSVFSQQLSASVAPLVADLIVEASLPISLVDYGAFKKLMSHLKCEIVGRNGMTHIITQKYALAKAELEQALEAAQGIAITTDSATTAGGLPFALVTLPVSPARTDVQPASRSWA